MYPLRYLRDGGGVAPPSDVYRMELGSGWVKVVLARRQTMGGLHLDDTA